jgi:hypothetical protein
MLDCLPGCLLLLLLLLEPLQVCAVWSCGRAA